MAKQKQQAVKTNEPLAGVTIRARKPRTVCPIKLQRQIGDAKDQFVDTFGTFEAAEDAWASVSQPGTYRLARVGPSRTFEKQERVVAVD